jgi:drug/metabolite transporter superfamily protein YnfA
MGTGASIVLIAAGAILRFAITIHSKIGSTTVNWDIVGDVLMAAGGIGLLMSLIWMATATRRRSADDTTYIERADRPSMS